MTKIPGLDLENKANLGFSRFAKHHVLYKIFHREHKEERSPCDTINSWITENGILHYCPMCDKLENCKNEKEPLCDFHSLYGVHFECLPKLFGVPFMKSSSDEFTHIHAYRLYVDLNGITTNYPIYHDHVYENRDTWGKSQRP